MTLTCALALAIGVPAAAASSTDSDVPSSGGAAIPAPDPATPAAPAPAGVGGVTDPAAPTVPPGTVPTPSTPAHPTVPGLVAQIIGGVAYAPALAPVQVQRAIWAGDKIRTKPYIWGGGHGKFKARGYDCSGSVSFVLHAAGLIRTPMDSSSFMSWATSGAGQWITVYTNPGHAFVEVAGIRLDTSAEADPHPAPGTGPRWRPVYQDPSGYQARHPLGF